MASSEIKIIGGQPDGSLLREMRKVFYEAQRAILCVAFTNRMGVALLEKELERVGRSGRVLLTTVFGETTKPALAALKTLGVEVKILNLSQGTYHPKVYLSESATHVSAAVGSANLTSGLIKNIEVMTVLRGARNWRPIREVKDLAEDLWHHRSAISFEELLMEAKDETFSTDLLLQLSESLPVGESIFTLAQGQPNEIVDISPAGVLVQTERSLRMGTGPQLVDAWMIELAWDYLKAQRELSNTTLLNELNVKRSSAVCAILAKVAGVEVASTKPIVLRLVEQQVSN
jgi:HKD family nuclease